MSVMLHSLPAPDSLWERLSNYCLLRSKRITCWLRHYLLPWQWCIVIDEVDKEMLGHAPDRLDLKSPRCVRAAARRGTLSPLTISSSQKTLAGVQGLRRMSFSVDLFALVRRVCNAAVR